MSRTTLWIVIGNLLVVVPLAFILSVGQDEAYSLITTGRSLTYAIHQAIVFEQNAPLYFILLWFWRRISTGYVWARLLSTCFTTSLIAVIPGLVSRYAKQVSAKYVTLAVAFNPLTIWAAVEIRHYALAMLLGALVMLFGYDAFVSPANRLRDLIAFIVVGAIASYTEYFLLFIVAGFGIVLVLLRSWRALGRYAIACAAMVALFVPMLIILPGQIAAFRSVYIGPSSLFDSFGQIGTIMFLQVFPLRPLPWHSEIAAAIGIAILGAIVAGRKNFFAKGPYLAVALLGASWTVYALAAYVLKSHIDFRYGAFLFALVVVAAFSALGWWMEPSRGRGAIAFTAAVLFLSAIALVVTYRSGAKTGDWRRVGAYLDANVQGPQPILVFESENALPLQYYYHGPGRIVALPRPVEFQSWDVSRFIVRSPDEMREALAPLGNPQKLWLVRAGACQSLNVNYGCGVVESFIASHYRTVSERQFFYANVRLLEPLKPAPFGSRRPLRRSSPVSSVSRISG